MWPKAGVWCAYVATASLGLQGNFVGSFRVLPTKIFFGSGSRHHATRLFSGSVSNLPTIDQLSKDPFMKQVSHASSLVSLLDDNTPPEQTTTDVAVTPLLEAQLSHSDGIRGFMVTYLTAAEGSPADRTTIPGALREALRSVEDATDLVSLACMNVIMPTAMTTVHTDPVQQEASRVTAQRGQRLLQFLATVHPTQVQSNRLAMLEAANPSDESSENAPSADPGLVKYWKEFYAKWGYQATQLGDITKAIKAIE